MKNPKVTFRFSLRARQAQSLYNLMACALEDNMFKEIWDKPKRRKNVRQAFARFERQLNAEYKRTGAEVI